jgi:hypothetical protein
MNRNVNFDVLAFSNKMLCGKIYIMNEKKEDLAKVLIDQGLVFTIEECNNYDS